jgi:glycosyltransferase involved in cell wall biosynthesis
MTTVLQVLEATEGGTRRHLRELVGTLDPAEFRCALAVACRRDPDFLSDMADYRSRGVPVTELRMRRGIAPVSDCASLCGLVRCVRRVRPGLIHAHSAKAGFLARLAGAVCRVPVVYTPHVFPFLMACGPRTRALYRRLERSVAPATAALIAVSGEEEAAALALGYPREKVFRIPNGVRPCDAGEIAVRAAGPLTVGFFGRLAPQKGPDVLLAAMAEVAVHVPQAQVAFFGGGELAERLRAQAAALGLEARVRFAGAYPQADAVSLMRQVDVVAVPSRWEGCPYGVLEAFQAGVPVVASAVGGVTDLLQDGVNGLCVAADQPEALGDALLALLRDPQKRRLFAERGRVCAAEHTAAAMTEAVAAVYRGAGVTPARAAAHDHQTQRGMGLKPFP